MRPPRSCSSLRAQQALVRLPWQKRSNFYAVELLASHSTCLIKHHHGLFYYSQGSSTSSAPFPPGLSNHRPTTLSLPPLPIHTCLAPPYRYARPRRCSASFHRHSAPLPLRPSPCFEPPLVLSAQLLT